MSLIRYEPLNLFNQFQKELGRFSLQGPFINKMVTDDNSDVAVNHWRPAVDIKEEANRFLIHADLPGVDPKDIEVTMEKGVLTIKGERSSEKTDENEGYKRVERARGTFYRSFGLPDTANAEEIEAKGENGVLEIVIPKIEKQKARRISVN